MWWEMRDGVLWVDGWVQRLFKSKQKERAGTNE